MSTSPFLLGLILLTISTLAHSIVPASQTFQYVNSGDFGFYITEYDASYRVLNPFAFPFQLCFYNTTPGAFTLSVRMGNQNSESTMRWVWDANRGNPVGENATLTFGTDGNLVLAEANGKVAWQTGTSNKGVVGFELLSNGNMVLKDNRGGFVWQSFDYPRDTLLIGQALRLGGVDRLISRVSDQNGSEGRYSLVVGKKTLTMYLKPNSSANPLVYYSYGDFPSRNQLSAVTFSAESVNDGFATDLRYVTTAGMFPSAIMVGRPKYNATLSMLRLGSDGSLMVYTYNDRVDWGAWEVTYSLFSRDGFYSVSECKLPTRCGALGVCEDNQCVACPTSKGLLGWSRECAPPSRPSCKGTVDYYKVAGVEHFSSDYTKGKIMKVDECRKRCSGDCKCLGFFYEEESSKCLGVPEIGTLIKVSNQTHVAYIKM